MKGLFCPNAAKDYVVTQGICPNWNLCCRHFFVVYLKTKETGSSYVVKAGLELLGSGKEYLRSICKERKGSNNIMPRVGAN
nr:uncharacterized protein LOC129014452 isoform X2 [Pongo pygmaeus]